MVSSLDPTIQAPDVSNLVTEDDTPVDNWLSEKNQRLLASSLYSSRPGETLIVGANVGIYYNIGQPPIVPDVFVSLGVSVPENWLEKKHRCYLIWEFGKAPEVAIEIVSNKKGGEIDSKLDIYSQMRVSYYAVYDPEQHLGENPLRIFELRGMRYFETQDTWLEQVELGLNLWDGEFEGKQGTWLRWSDVEGNILQTGDERANRLAEKLREMGVDPDNL